MSTSHQGGNARASVLSAAAAEIMGSSFRSLPAIVSRAPGECHLLDVALVREPAQREVAPDRRQIERAQALRDRDREGGGLVDADGDETGREAGLSCANSSGDRN